MNGRIIYQGEHYCFYRNKKSIGQGGNGAVYEIVIKEFDYPIVAKFFEYEGKNKKKRYERFKKEIEAMGIMRGIEGIMPVLDKNIPPMLPKKKDESWFVMPKAECYKVISSILGHGIEVNEKYYSYDLSGREQKQKALEDANSKVVKMVDYTQNSVIKNGIM